MNTRNEHLLILLCSPSPLVLAQIAADRLTKVAEENWSAAAQSAEKPPSFRPELVQEIYKRELGGGAASPPKLKRVMMLEISQYLENYLWPFFDEEASSNAHIMSILVNPLPFVRAACA